MSAAPRWGLSPLNWRSHAIDERRDHPIGVLIADCGHRLMTVHLHDRPHRTPCDACATQQLARAMTDDSQQIGPAWAQNIPVSRPARWALSSLDYAARLVTPHGDQPHDVLTARCGHPLATAATVSTCHRADVDDPSPPGAAPAPLDPRPAAG